MAPLLSKWHVHCKSFKSGKQSTSTTATAEFHDELKHALNNIHGQHEALKQNVKDHSSDVYKELYDTYPNDVGVSLNLHSTIIDSLY